jgi:plastocyanin
MLSFILTVLPLAIAQSIQIIEVGKGGNKFSPETLTAAVNSTVQFSFVGEGHSVSASAFTGPCKPVDDATFFSGDGEVVS